MVAWPSSRPGPAGPAIPVRRRRVTRLAMAALGLMIALPAPLLAEATGEPIRIGEINSYSALPQFLEPYRRGWTLAMEQANAAGGVDGRPLEVLWRDDDAKPADAVRLAEELIRREGVAMIFGGFLSNIGLALSDNARQRNWLYLASEPLTDALVWSAGNANTFRLRPSNSMQTAMLAEEAARLGVTRWATVAPNYAYGQDAVAAFKAELTRRQPGVQFIAEQWPPQFKIDAGATVTALAAAEPEAIFNATFGTDLAKFVREGRLRGLFDNRPVVSLLTGEPEYLEPLGAEAPEGWIVTGYPWYAIDTPEHTAFRQAYEARFAEPPKLGSLVGYVAMQSVVAALRRAQETTGSLETAALIAAFEGLTHDSPVGPITYRDSDHQSTMGAWVGRTAVVDGQPVMVDWRYAPGADYLPPPAEAARLRPPE